jgi:hypothetical protein
MKGNIKAKEKREIEMLIRKQSKTERKQRNRVEGETFHKLTKVESDRVVISK